MKATAIKNDAAPASAAQARRRRARVTVEPICADCQFSDVYAIETRAHCEHPNAALHGAVLFAGQPACADFVARIGDDLTLSAFRAGCGGTAV
jgi:hypothetical protein